MRLELCKGASRKASKRAEMPFMKVDSKSRFKLVKGACQMKDAKYMAMSKWNRIAIVMIVLQILVVSVSLGEEEETLHTSQPASPMTVQAGEPQQGDAESAPMLSQTSEPQQAGAESTPVASQTSKQPQAGVEESPRPYYILCSFFCWHCCLGHVSGRQNVVRPGGSPAGYCYLQSAWSLYRS